MERSERKLTELSKVLGSGKDAEIENRIKLLRAESPFEGAIRLLALHYDKSDNENVRRAIARFFNDIKENAGKDEVIESLSLVTKNTSKAMIASSCWQSGLDYSEHASSIAGIFITGDYITALECFTVLENCSGSINESDRARIILSLENEAENFEPTKKKLAEELMIILRG